SGGRPRTRRGPRAPLGRLRRTCPGPYPRCVIALVFSYEVHDAAEFERVYGSDGEWAEFFREGRGYIGTELLRDVEAPGGSLAIVRWESADASNSSVAERREDYMERVDATRFRYDSELRFGTSETLS